MLRGIYTAASSMAGRQIEMDVVANNLANINTTGYKRDETIYKAFPEMLIRRINDDGVRTFRLGSYDVKPVVGRLGTGVEVNEVYTQKGQSSLQETHNPLDFALEGKGYFVILTEDGERYTRNGSFLLNQNNQLVTKDGHLVLGEQGPLRLQHNNFIVGEDGLIDINPTLSDPSTRPVQQRENGFEETLRIGRLRVVQFPFERYLKKIGTSMFVPTEESGEAFDARENRPLIRQGFFESSNVNGVREMVKMIEVHRAYEAAQKTITGQDSTLDKLINQVARI